MANNDHYMRKIMNRIDEGMETDSTEKLKDFIRELNDLQPQPSELNKNEFDQVVKQIGGFANTQQLVKAFRTSGANIPTDSYEAFVESLESFMDEYFLDDDFDWGELF